MTKVPQVLVPVMTLERLAEIRDMKPSPSPDIIDRYHNVCQRANTVPELLAEIERLQEIVDSDMVHERVAPLTIEQVQAALNQGRIERKQAEGDHAWISLVNHNAELTQRLESMTKACNKACDRLDEVGLCLLDNQACDCKKMCNLITALRKP